MPPLQVPLAAKVRRVVLLAQVGPGGMLHVTPAQGSPAHAPLVQPFVQVVSVGAYVHAPLEHVPADEKVRMVFAFTHCEAGGELQVVSCVG